MLGSAKPVLILITSGVGDSADPPVLTSTAANCTGNITDHSAVKAASGSCLSSSRLDFGAEQLLHTANVLALGLPSLPVKHVQRKSLSVKERTGCLAMIKAAPPPR